MLADQDALDFGKALRVRVDEAVAAAVQDHIAALQRGMHEYAKGIAVEAVRKIAVELRGDIVAATKYTDRVIDQMDQRQSKFDDQLNTLAGAGFENVTKTMHRAAAALNDARELQDAIKADQDQQALAVAKVIAVAGDMQAATGGQVAALESLLGRVSASVAAEIEAQVTKHVTTLPPRDYRGPYTEGMTCKRGDLVTYLGTTFIAKRDTTDRPLVTTDDPAFAIFAAGGVGGAGTKGDAQLRKLAKTVDDLATEVAALRGAT